jgi:hypothetical protein
MKQCLKAAVLYFALVFGAGFVLGPIRVLWVVPRVGTRAAELMEMPIMFVVIVAAARWVVRRLAVPPARADRLAMGTTALALVLLMDFTVVLRLRGMSIEENFAARDPVSGTAYYLLLVLLAAMPSLVVRK